MDKALGSTYEISIDGKTYPLATLTFGDMADAAAYIKAERFSLIAGGTRTVPMTEEARGACFGTVANCTILNHEIVDDMSGRIKLLQLSLERGGKKFSMQEIAEKVSPPTIKRLLEILFYITGFLENEDDKSVNPTITSET